MTPKKAWLTSFGTAASVGSLMVALAFAPAHANSILQINDGMGHSVSLNDGGTGEIFFMGALGSWTLDLELGLTEPILGTTHLPEMHLTTSALGDGTLNVSFIDDSFVGSGSPEFFSSIGGTLAEGASLSGGSSLLDGTSTPIATLSAFGPFGSGSFGTSQSAVDPVSGGYGLGLFETLTQTEYGASSFDADVKVPEPSTFALFGAALISCVLLVSRRRRAPIAV